MRVEKPWGEEEELIGGERFSLWRLTILQGQETSLHYHANKDAFIVVEEGQLRLWKDGEPKFLSKGDWAVVEKGVIHRLESKWGAKVIELEWPPSREDLVRVSDRYGRAGR